MCIFIPVQTLLLMPKKGIERFFQIYVCDDVGENVEFASPRAVGTDS